MKRILAGAVTVLGSGMLLAAIFAWSNPALAQVYIDTRCGTWVNDVWVPNGSCPPENPSGLRHEAVAGTITGVTGHLVTVQQTGRSLTINDQPALDRQQTGKVAVGRQIVAYGYWDSGTFYATSIY